jgi:hypothetical protein
MVSRLLGSVPSFQLAQADNTSGLSVGDIFLSLPSSLLSRRPCGELSFFTFCTFPLHYSPFSRLALWANIHSFLYTCLHLERIRKTIKTQVLAAEQKKHQFTTDTCHHFDPTPLLPLIVYISLSDCRYRNSSPGAQSQSPIHHLKHAHIYAPSRSPQPLTAQPLVVLCNCLRFTPSLRRPKTIFSSHEVTHQCCGGRGPSFGYHQCFLSHGVLLSDSSCSHGSSCQPGRSLQTCPCYSRWSQ